ncbi:MAG TPA: hypothetical protein VJN20_01925 [Burkholderiales bacterium]|nr:hypothetical protein [Burkholderiales bacterium]
MTTKLSVHDPRGYPPKVTGKRLAPRLQSLDGKVVYLVDCLFDNSEAFMNELLDWFGEHLPAVNARIIKPRQSWVDDPDMRKRVEAEGQAAILGVGL